MNPGSVVVSIHDVSPLTRETTQTILSELEREGFDRVSLLVVPDHHHRGLISEDAAFAAWLRDQCRAGHEAVLHGFYHLRENRAADGLWKRAVTRSYTAGEGEFFDLGAAEASERLRRGRAALEACGVTPTGFIAPAWLLGAEAETAVRDADFEYTTRIATVSDFRGGRVHRSRSLVWSVRASWRRICSLAWNALVLRKETSNRLLRIGIHPPDWEHPAIRRQILQLATRALAAREPMSYEQWLARIRAER